MALDLQFEALGVKQYFISWHTLTPSELADHHWKRVLAATPVSDKLPRLCM